ncbi:probable rRNA-processing protein EBP2 homolog [Mercurialis annua]|uniref:probable rRNA-processing protein EBP2 homolog n=1 Tax=Mercurialis annua TaxID=3986 RepID=UPI00215F359E|nr:probable rRNA-processing protein EBP2 homolog [Mercurialis annua]
MGARAKSVTRNDEDSMEDEEIDNVNEKESDSESELESESEEEDVKQSEPSKNAIFNRDGLLDKLQDISWPENVSWIHKLSIDIEQEQVVDVNDDLARELAFYTQALEGTRKAFEKIEATGLPFLRPSDYYAEMVKTDVHMGKVKGRLLAEKKNMEEAEERKKARESKKLSKEVQAQKQKERAAQKKGEIESVKKWRKQRQQSGFPGGDKGGDMKLPFDDGEAFGRPNKKRPGVSPGDRSGGKGKKDWNKKQNKRDGRDSKFGFGGRKGLKKQNAADTTNNFKGFNKDSGAAGNKKRKR